MKEKGDFLQEPPLFLVGPTAAGKSEIAVEWAVRIGGEIISADSMQVYRGMDIGTAKLPMSERKGIPHHLIDVLEIQESWDVAKFRKMALAIMEEIRRRGKRPIVVGGSGLYVRALTHGLFEGTGKNEVIRRELEALGRETLAHRLREADPVSAARISKNDRKRMIRALECFMTTGHPISSLQKQWASEFHAPHSTIHIQMIGLERPRAEIYGRCDKRVEEMLKQGLEEEVKRLMERGLKTGSNPGRAIGYAEMMDFLSGNLTREAMVTLIKQRTRQFAKRQWTWFRREPQITWMNVGEGKTPAESMEQLLRLIP